MHARCSYKLRCKYRSINNYIINYIHPPIISRHWYVRTGCKVETQEVFAFCLDAVNEHTRYVLHDQRCPYSLSTHCVRYPPCGNHKNRQLIIITHAIREAKHGTKISLWLEARISSRNKYAFSVPGGWN